MKKRSFNKEQVYRRLLRNAGELWGIHEAELESMDPLAKMLLGATSKEIERIGNELQSSDTRIFRRIAQYLLPDELQQAIPAHGILQMQPVESDSVTRYEEFNFEKRWRNKADLNKVETTDLRFSPAGEFSTSESRLAYRVNGLSLLITEGVMTEEVARLSESIPHNEILLGFRMGNEPKSEVRLYFDWLNTSDKHRLIDEFSKLSIHDMEENSIAISPGPRGSANDLSLSNLVSVSSRVEEKVVDYYAERFVRFTIDESVSSRIPPLLGEPLDAHGEDEPTRLRWVKLLLPAGLNAQQIAETVIVDNAVPVLNRTLNKSIFRMHKDLNIKRLDFQNFFLDVEQAESNQGTGYQECPSLDIMDMDKGSYSIRIGGTGRLDERDGQEYLNYMLDLLRDEKQSFSSLDVNSMVGDLRNMEQILRRVKKRLGDGKRGSKQPYVILKPHTSAENAHIYFWSTDGAMANGIPLNSRLRSRNAGLSKSGQLTLITTTIGGKNEMDGKQMVQAYRSAVLSRGTVVTKRDILERCATICEGVLAHLKIDKGVMTSTTPGEGLLRTLDIHVMLKRDTAEELAEHLRQQMQSELKSASNFAMPLRVFTNILKEDVVGVA